MADRFSRFLKLERPHQRGEQQTPVANAERFAHEEGRAPGSGLTTDEEPADAQPFLRCAQCEMDNTRFAQRCSNCGAALLTPEQELYNRQLWQKRRAEAAAEEEALRKMHQPAGPADPEQIRQQLSRWRWRAGCAAALWLGGTGLAALRTHHPVPMWLFFGSAAVLLALFTPARRRRYWWSSGWW